MRKLRVAVLVALALVSLCAGLLLAGWLFLGSDAGLRWVVSQAHLRTGNRLKLEGAKGSLDGTVHIARLTYADDDLRLVADDVELSWSPRALLSRSVLVDEVAAAAVTLELKPGNGINAPPPSLALPWQLDVQRASIARLDVTSGENRWRFVRLAFHYSGGERHHALDDLAFDSEWGSLRGNVAMNATRPFAAEGKLAFAGSDKLYRTSASLAIGGELGSLTLTGEASAAGARAQASMHVTPFSKAWMDQTHAQLSEVDLSRFDPRLPSTLIAGSIDGSMENDGGLRGRLTAQNSVPGPLSANRLPVAALSSSLRSDRETMFFDGVEARVGETGRVVGRGRIGEKILRWDLAISNFDLRALAPDLRSTRLAGAVTGDVRLDKDEAEGTLAGELRQAGIALAFDAAVRAGSIDVRSFRARAHNGSLEGRATLATTGPQTFRVSAVATRLDPSAFGDYPQASLSASLDALGSLRPSWSSALSFKLAESRWRGLPIGGGGRLTLSRSRLSDADVNLFVGENRLNFAGSFGRSGDALVYSLDARDLRAVDPRLEGRVRASGRVGGTWEAPSLTAAVTGSALRFGTAYAAATINVDAEIAALAASGERPLKFDIVGSGVRIDAVALRTASMKVSGTLAHHEGAITAKAALPEGDLDIDARMSGGWSGNARDGWSGWISALQTRGAYTLALVQPAQFEAGAGRIHLAGARGTLLDGRFAVDELRWDEGKLSSSGEFSRLPAAPLLALGGGSPSVASTLTISGRWSFGASPRLNGTLTASRDGGDLAPAGSPEYALGLTRLELNATGTEDRLHVTLTARSRYGDADVVADAGPPPQAPGRFDKTTPLSLSARVDASSLRALQALAGTTAIIDGRIKLDLAGRGSLERVRLTGSVDGDALKIEAPHYGVYLKDGVVRARLADDAVTVGEMSFAAGEGRFVASGVLPASADFSGSRLTWKADKLALFNRPDTRLTLSGAGTLAMQKRHVTLEGKLSADEAYFEFRPVRREVLGEDVVVRGRERETSKTQRIPFSVDLDLDFGDRFTFVGEGFDTGLAGKVHVKTNDVGELAGTGTIRAVHGTYTAFGQRLAIERGELYFDGPLDNPGLDVFALRKNLSVEAGVEVTGTVRVPRVQLTSNPPVPDNEKLAWLVLGHGLDSANSADAAALQAAFAALGGMGGAPFGQRIARTFGVDDISLRAADPGRLGTGGQIVAVSKRLSDKLSLVYEQGLSVANNALKVEYALSRTVTLRAEAGFVNGFGIYYSRSFD